MFMVIAKRKTIKTFRFLRSKRILMVMVLRLERSLFMDSAQRLVALFVDGGKRVSVLRHTLPKFKSPSIYTDSVDNATVHIGLEMAAWHRAFSCLYAETNDTIEFTSLCF